MLLKDMNINIYMDVSEPEFTIFVHGNNICIYFLNVIRLLDKMRLVINYKKSSILILTQKTNKMRDIAT